MHPVVYLPMELKFREFPSRLLLTAHLLKLGCAVIAGQPWGLLTNLKVFPQGACFFKSLNKIQGAAMLKVKASGHLIVANDEEALNFIQPNGFLQGFHESASHCDLFFAQSQAHQRAVTEAFPHMAGKVRTVGNPRLDVLTLGLFDKTDYDAGQEPYILFNTNYGTINSVWNQGNQVNIGIAESAGAFDGPNQQEKIREFESIMTWEQRNFDAMVALIKWTAENLPNLNLVIRPHPAEKPGFWKEMFAAFPRVSVIPRSDPHPWIENAKVIVHTGCTTGLEAAVLRRPAINLLPTDHPTCDRIVTYVNPTFRTWEAAAEALKSFAQSGSGPIADFDSEPALMVHLPTARTATATADIASAIAAELRAQGSILNGVIGPTRGVYL